MPQATTPPPPSNAGPHTAWQRPADVTDEGQVRRAMEWTLAEQSQVDVLVNNAATSHRGQITALPAERWQEQVLETDLGGAFLCARAVPAPHGAAPATDGIVNVASVYGVVGRDGSLFAGGGQDTRPEHGVLR